MQGQHILANKPLGAHGQPIVWQPNVYYGNVAKDYAVTSLRSFPGTDGFDYYVIGSVPVPGGKGGRFSISVRVFLHEMKPRLTLDFRIRVGDAYKETPGNPLAIFAVDEKSFEALGPINKEWTSAIKQGSQHRSITGRMVAAEHGSDIGAVINAAIHNYDIQALYWTLAVWLPEADLIPETDFVKAFARMMVTAASNMPASWTSISLGSAITPLLSSVDGDLKTWRDPQDPPKGASPVPVKKAPTSTPSAGAADPDLGPAPKVKMPSKASSKASSKAANGPTAADIGL